MSQQYSIFDRRWLLRILGLLLSVGFITTSLIGYLVSKQAIHDAIIAQDLPLTSSNIYSEIQKDLVRPVLISSTMAHDTFLRDWVLRGEKDVSEMARYLREGKTRYNAFSSFFISDRSSIYYTAEGVLKRVSPREPRDVWYYRVRDMKQDYEINVDPDLANRDALTIFINFRVKDYDGRYIGATGISLTVASVRKLIMEHQQRFKRKIFFVNNEGKVVLSSNFEDANLDLRKVPGLGVKLDQIMSDKKGSYQYQKDGDDFILNVNYLPELKWFMFVEQNETASLSGIRKTLCLNLIISFIVTLVVVRMLQYTLMRYQNQLEEMASTDKLTGLLNRHAFFILIDKQLADFRREPRPISILLIDIDHFKTINDQYGHKTGDEVLIAVAHKLQGGLRASDIAVRWGGEEFLLVLKRCSLPEAQRIAETLRNAVVESPVVVNDRQISLTVSIGLSEYSGNETPDQMVDRADSALYRAKKGGRNRTEVAT